MNDDLSTRFAAFEAREAIRDLVIRYGMAVDDRDMATVESMFTKDATFGQGDITLGSLQEIVDFYTDRLKAFGATYHYTNGHVVDLGGPDTATGVVNAHAELSLQDRTFISGMRYYDQYRHVDNRWKFAHRQLRTIYFMDLAEFTDGGLAATDRRRYFGDVGPADLPESTETWQNFFAEANK